MPNNQKRFAPAVITALIMALILGALGYLVFNNKQIRQSPTRQIITTPSIIPAEDFCELNKEYESSSKDPIDCECPQGSTKKFEITGWGKCPVEGMTDCPKAKFKCTPDETMNWKVYKNEKYGFTTKHYPDSPPTEIVGNTEVGQFTYLFKVNFGTNPVKFPFGYELSVRLPRSIDDYKIELVGHITDRIDSVEQSEINGNTWTKINYKMFLTTDYIPITTAYINKGKYDYTVTTHSGDIDLIISTFKFLDSKQVPAISSQSIDDQIKLCKGFTNGSILNESDTGRTYFGLPKAIYPKENFKLTFSGATAGEVSNFEDLGYNQDLCWETRYEFDLTNSDQNGYVELFAESQDKQYPDYKVRVNVWKYGGNPDQGW